jgi:hypothetical protein
MGFVKLGVGDVERRLSAEERVGLYFACDSVRHGKFVLGMGGSMNASDASRRRKLPPRNRDKLVRTISQTVAMIAIALVGLILLTLTHAPIQAQAVQPVHVSQVASH